ncbi:MAG: UDP-N-acetylglucosamine--N-acetylmuramyl-(pentapeptide) pyrophosphoryl-undecaprenol N-acetylglucosamine transferase [Thermoanaerobaculia bacterium]
MDERRDDRQTSPGHGDRHGARAVVIAGGGSGGHVFPGLAVADVLLGRGCRVSWMGRPHGMERELVLARGLGYDAVRARPLVGRGPSGRLLALATLAPSGVRAALLLHRRRSVAVLGTGGYVCAPAVLGATLGRIPAVLLEPNAHAGTANRWLSRRVRAAAVGHAATARDLACPSRHTGVPVRAAFFDVPEARPAARCRLLVLGGSQGAQDLNRALPVALAALGRRGVAARVLHQAGREHGESTRRAWAEAAVPPSIEARVCGFVDDVAGAMADADLVVSRAGAITLAEVCAAGRASLLVPLSLAGGHQADNAAELERAGAARVAGADVEGLTARLAELLARPELLVEMGRRARSLAKPRAAEEIADLVLEAAA